MRDSIAIRIITDSDSDHTRDGIRTQPHTLRADECVSVSVGLGSCAWTQARIIESLRWGVYRPSIPRKGTNSGAGPQFVGLV